MHNTTTDPLPPMPKCHASTKMQNAKAKRALEKMVPNPTQTNPKRPQNKLKLNQKFVTEVQGEGHMKGMNRHANKHHWEKALGKEKEIPGEGG